MIGAFARGATVARHEFRTAWRRVSTWVLVLIVLLLAWGFVAGSVTIGTGSASVGGERAHMNSMFNIAFTQIAVFSLFYLFFVAIAFGTSVLEDDAARIGPMLHSTPLSVNEYVWGRFIGQTIAYVVLVALNVAFLVAFMQLYPVDEPAKVRGAFALVNYVWPTVFFVLPPLIFFGGVSFALGAATRQAVLVFLLPVATLLGCVFFLWNFSPEWLPEWVNRLFQFIDPTGLRWLTETHLKVDRGAAYYNTNPIELDAVIVANRLTIIAVGVAGVAFAATRESRRLRGPRYRKGDVPSVLAAADRDDVSRRAARIDADAAHGATLPVSSQSKPGALATFRAALGAETRELRRAPGLILFVPLIVLQVVGAALSVPGAFDTPLLLSPGSMAASTFNTVTLLTVLLILFYATESLARDDRARTTPIVRSSGSRIGAIIAGRLFANCVVVLLAVLGGVYVGACIALLVQGIRSGQWIAPSPGPFVLVWSMFLLPTVLVWLSFIALSWAVTRNRFAVYGLGLGVLMLTGWAFVRGWVTWVFNWHLWGAARWTDFGPFELDRIALVMNRALWLSVAVAFFAIAMRVLPKRVGDPQGATARRRPWPLTRAVLGTLPYVVVPLVLAITLGVMVRNGNGGGLQRRLQKDYWRKNVNTWREVRQPMVDDVELDLTLDPAAGSFRVEGAYLLRNHEDDAMARFALTPGLHYQDLEWDFDGGTYKKDDQATTKRESPAYDSAGLWVFTPKQPLAKDETIRVGFRYHGTFPNGISRNAGGAGEFILPSGVVLNSFSPSMLPMIGFIDGVGLEAGDQPEPRVPEPDEWKKRTRPAFGYGAQSKVKARITLPAEYRANCPGVLVSDVVEGDRRVMTWETDQPIRFFNVVAGKWVEHKGELTSIWYLPAHERNVEEMSQALDGARRYYSEWFYPYPWKELRLTEFPGLAGYAQGFGTNIVFSENIGFRARTTEEERAPFMITAHEAAHQWWGNILMPGDGPGGNLLSEGMAHFSTARLCGQLQGERGRQWFLRKIEDSYQEARKPDDERPLVEIDGSRPGDTTVTYDKAGWVFYMLMELMGRESCDKGLRGFITKFKDGPDYPLLQDFVAFMRDYAPDKKAYDAFVDQWFFKVVVPEFRIEGAKSTHEGESWITRATVQNVGTARVTVEIGVTNGKERWEKPKDPKDEYADARVSVTLGPGDSAPIEIRSAFEPARIVVDPDVHVLQIKRKQAEAKISA
ncbi:MAG: M1 family aminopeptidase [Phycisphaerales bacterium]